MSNFQIAIDGPSSSGKSTVAQAIAKKLDIIYIDTGAMYRAVTLAVLQDSINVSDAERVEKKLSTLNLSFKRSDEGIQEMYLNNQNVSREIRSDVVTANVSEISAYPFVREKLVEDQRNMASTHSVVMDGRDIGTVVLPHAEYKFFLNASAKVRAKRRFDENIEKGLSNQTLEEIEESIVARDHYDSNREHSPLKKADDAIELETDHLSVEQVVNTIINHIKK
ncbi:(d)CMP kinase [Aerococcaceae bacterium INB8]|uniref:Cytidylate kinase n=1 Tax=Ruoffia halotolerans TaxID=2748684 RepID=A0A839A6B6_9LACT|nr:(d)CMP kinase [Ruoffia halotolerans]MBA5729360.1 (d)CMP kinase [Ruoffia halotolerans]